MSRLSQLQGPVLILGAMDAEIAEFLRALDHGTREKWRGFELHCGRIEGRDVVAAKCGVGKTMAACLTQRLVDTFGPSAIICTGLAGGLAPDLDVGDTVIARDCIQHDLDATALGFARGEVPYSQRRVLVCDPELVNLAAAVEPLTGRATVGRVLTGDQFLVSANLTSYDYLRSELAGDAVEMEGASVGLVAEINEIPFLIIRTISDKADGRIEIDFKAFLKETSRSSLHFVSSILRSLS